MIALGLREFHQFHAAGRQFLHLVPSAAVFELDLVAEAVILLLTNASRTEDAVIEALAERFPAPAVRAAISELRDVRAIGYQQQPEPKEAMRGRATIPITHHFSLASEADRVVILGDRGILEQGQPAELLAGGGQFASLFAR